MKNAQDNAISNALQWLCSPRGGNNFYGRIMNGVRRIEVPGIKSAAVTIDNQGHFYLAYDLNWFTQKPVEDQLFILQHEACHLVLQHIPRVTKMFRELACNQTLSDPLNHRIINIAMDCAVNGGLLHKIMKTTLSPEHPYVDPVRDFDLPNTLLFEEYLDKLIEKATIITIRSGLPKNGEPGGDSSTENDDNGNGEKGEENDDNSEKEKDESNDEKSDQSETGDGSGDQDEDPENTDEKGDGDDSVSTEENEGSGDEESESSGSEEESDNLNDIIREEYPKHVCDYTKQLSNKTEAELERMETEMLKTIKETVKKAYDQTLRRRGTIPAEVRQIVEALLLEPQVPWEQIFRNMMRSSITTKVTDSSFIPAYNLLPVMNKGILPYPGLQNDMSFNLSIHLDTSGSMSDQDFVTCMTEVSGIIRNIPNVNIHLIMFDSVIQFENFYSEIDVEALRIEMRKYSMTSFNRYGRGGTDFSPSFKRMVGVDEPSDRAGNCAGNYEENRMTKPDMMLMLTDGCAPVSSEQGGPIPTYLPNCPVIWVICGGTNASVHPAMGQRVVILN